MSWVYGGGGTSGSSGVGVSVVARARAGVWDWVRKREGLLGASMVEPVGRRVWLGGRGRDLGPGEESIVSVVSRSYFECN